MRGSHQPKMYLCGAAAARNYKPLYTLALPPDPDVSEVMMMMMMMMMMMQPAIMLYSMGLFEPHLALVSTSSGAVHRPVYPGLPES